MNTATLFIRRLFALLAMAGAATAQPPTSIAGQPASISVTVNLVVLYATVTDRKGQPASDLRQQDFEVYENGVRQSIRLFRHEDVPVTIGLVVDHSGSMRHKLPDVLAAARTFVRYSNPMDQLFIVNFNEHATFGLPAAVAFSNRVDELAKAIANTPASGMTALYDAVILGGTQLQKGTAEKKVLVVVSDGGDNASKHTLAQVLDISGQSNAQIYTIGIFDSTDPDRNPGVLRRLSQATGGQAFLPGTGNDIVSICERIARDIRHQYTLGYVSSHSEQAGAYRTIRVVARSGGEGKLNVRTRSGYNTRPVSSGGAQ